MSRGRPVSRMPSARLRVAFVSSEVHPYSKTGGLADVSAALPAALADAGTDVTVLTPGYRSALQWFAERNLTGEELELPGDLWIGDVRHPVRYRRFVCDGRSVVLVVNDELYDRPSLYVDVNGEEYADNAARFAFFCRAVLEYFCLTGEPPAVFHAHDWQAALVPVYLRTLYAYSQVASARSLLTVHNLGYQGLFPATELYATGLGWDVFHMEGLEFYGRLNLLKGGIVYADAVTTVSPTYAKEIQTESFGMGLDGLLRAHRRKLRGILNGIDTDRWNPATDRHLPACYSHSDPAGKATCKRVLQERLGLPVRPEAFLLGVISRLDRQKGLALLLDAWPMLQTLDLQLVVLGSGDPVLETAFTDLASRMPSRVAVRLGFDEPLAHLIEAGSDAFVMPSLYEPCGLNQLYSQRYGTIPIVRRTGGLADTVVDATPERMTAGDASGFSFRPMKAEALADAICRAGRMYFEQPEEWGRLARGVMQLEHGWPESARKYHSLYRRLVRGARPSA